MGSKFTSTVPTTLERTHDRQTATPIAGLPDIREMPPGIATEEYPVKVVTRDLNLFYGAKQALNRITLDIRERQVTAFIGPSGCGKSTYLRTLNRMNDLIAGVKISGQVQV